MNGYMDDTLIEAGDKVYDLALSWGVVEEVTGEDSVRVRFPSAQNRVIAFNKGVRAKIGLTRTLYWHNPVVLPPPSNGQWWAMVAAVTKEVYDIVRKYNGRS